MTPIRRATPRDAPILAKLVHAASEGLAEVFWRSAAGPREDPWDVGRRRQAAKTLTDDEIWVIDIEGGTVAALTGYPIGARPEPPGPETPALFHPLVALEAEAPSSWYVNVLAVLPGHRDHGHGTSLLQLAEHRARAAGLERLSIIVADVNTGARRLYERVGYAETARRAMVKTGWDNPGREWVLMIRPL